MKGLALAAAVAVTLAPAPAAADKADQLFAKGKAQLAKKQYAEACATFEKVDALDPGIGAKVNVARCYQEWGKLARAHRWYADAEKMAVQTRDKRAAKIKELIEALDPDVPRLTIKVSEGADVEAAAITLDGAALAAEDLGREARVDPGPHEIAYVVSGEKKSRTIAIERGGAREVTLELPAGDGAGASGSEPGGGSTPPAPGRTRRVIAFALMGAGAASLGAAGYLAIDARGDYRDALTLHCMDARDMCNEDGLRLTRDARGQANLATVITIAGAAAVAGGVALLLTAPSSGQPESLSRNPEALYLVPAIGDRAGLLVLGGRY